MKLRLFSALMFLGACGGIAGEDGAATDEVVGGTPAGTLHPEVGKLWYDGTYCTATLIRQNVAITAAHCVQYRTGEDSYGSIELGGYSARFVAYASLGTRVGFSDVALVRVEPVPTSVARAASLSGGPLAVGDPLTVFGFGCDDRANRVSAGKRYRRVSYGSSKAVCPGDSGGPGFAADGGIATITSGFASNGLDVFALPTTLRSQIDAQLRAWGAGEVSTTAPAPSGGLAPGARVWRRQASISACGDWSSPEDFSSGRYNAHQLGLALPAGDVEIELSVRSGAWQPLLLAAVSGAELYDGEGAGSASGVEASELESGRSGSRASVRLHLAQAKTLELVLSSWAARASGFGSNLPTDAKYLLTVRSLCASPSAPSPGLRLPLSVAGDTRTGASRISRYDCSSANESGPEIEYPIEVRERGFLALELSGSPSGVDVDVHLLSSDGRCLSRGDVTAGALVEPGAYRVIVDSYVTRSGAVRSGAYRLRAGLTTEGELASFGLDAGAARAALTAFARAYAERATDELVYGIADLSARSGAARLFVVDLPAEALLLRAHVAHGAGSSDPADRQRVARVGNEGALSSAGLFVTGALGGDSLALEGIEPGFNDGRALALELVPGYDEADGAPPESDGAFSLASDLGPSILRALSGGALLLSYYPDAGWLASSDYLR